MREKRHMKIVEARYRAVFIYFIACGPAWWSLIFMLSTRLASIYCTCSSEGLCLPSGISLIFLLQGYDNVSLLRGYLPPSRPRRCLPSSKLQQYKLSLLSLRLRRHLLTCTAWVLNRSADCLKVGDQGDKADLGHAKESLLAGHLATLSSGGIDNSWYVSCAFYDEESLS